MQRGQGTVIKYRNITKNHDTFNMNSKIIEMASNTRKYQKAMLTIEENQITDIRDKLQTGKT